MLNQNQLTAIQQKFIQVFLTDECTILRVTKTQDDETGEFVTTSTQEVVACIVEPLSASQVSFYGYDVNASNYSITVPPDTEITQKDKVVWRDLTITIKQVLGPDTNEILRECTGVVDNG